MKLDLTNDIVFKAFFSKKGNEEFLKTFLEDFLEKKIHKIEITKDAALEKIKMTDKLGILDLKTVINNSETINVEVQVKDEKNIEKRTLFYGAKLIAAQISSGEDYEKIKPTILINILNYEFIKLENYHTKTVRVAKENRNYELVNGIEYHFIELPKFKREVKEIKTRKEAWLALISEREGRLAQMGADKYPIIKKAKEELDHLTGDEEIQRLNELREKALRDEASAKAAAYKEGMEKGIADGRIKGMREGRIEGRAKGRAEGRAKEKTEIAKEMMREGINKELISKITKLSIEQINAIK